MELTGTDLVGELLTRSPQFLTLAPLLESIFPFFDKLREKGSAPVDDSASVG